MRRPLFAVCLLLVAIAALRLWWTQSVRGEQTEKSFFQNGQSVTVSGRVCSRDNSSFLLDSVILLSDAADSRQEIQTFKHEKWICEYEMPCSVQEDDGVGKVPQIGSLVTVRGDFCTFSAASNPGQFDTEMYYRTIGVTGRMKNVSVLVAGSHYSRWREALDTGRVFFRSRLYQVFPTEEASVMAAMLLGDKEGLNREIKDLYQRNGIIHILSISGLHITLIGMGLYRLLRRLGMPQWLAAVCSGCVLLLYGVLTGMGVSACRAIGMYVIRMGGEVLGRSYDMLTALGVMAVILVWSNPWYLCHAGFLLSFSSVLGIALLAPALETGRRRGTSAGVAVTLFTMPVQLWFYYEIPVWSFLLNMLILPLMSAVVGTGILVMLLPGSGLLGTVTCLILKGYELLCHLFEKLPFHTWCPGKPEVWQVLVYYGILLGFAFGARHRKKRYGTKAGSLAAWKKVTARFMILPAVLIFAVSTKTGDRVIFLDVGQGDCILLEMKTGETYLFDCGSSSRTGVGQYVLLPYLKYRGIREINAVFVSHADTDHCNGIVELLENGEEEGIRIKQLVLPAIVKEQRTQEFAEIIDASGEKTVLSYVGAGAEWKQGRLRMTCLNPPKGYSVENNNAYSECFYVQIGNDFSMLLTGDVEGEGELLLTEELTRRNMGGVSILKVAHHGSAYSTKEEFLEIAKPAVSVISCGRNNRYGHPHEETLNRLEDAGSLVYQTNTGGAVMVDIQKGAIRVETYLPTEVP